MFVCFGLNCFADLCVCDWDVVFTLIFAGVLALSLRVIAALRICLFDVFGCLIMLWFSGYLWWFGDFATVLRCLLICLVFIVI